jgi:hypothetical protein
MKLKEAQAYLAKECAKYSDKFVLIPNPPQHQSESFVRAFRNCFFLVQEFNEQNDIVRLSIQRTRLNSKGGWLDGITWDEIQKIKDDIGYHDKCAVEIYPPKDSIVNVANIRHIFILPEPPKYMWKKGATQ